MSEFETESMWLLARSSRKPRRSWSSSAPSPRLQDPRPRTPSCPFDLEGSLCFKTQGRFVVRL